MKDDLCVESYYVRLSSIVIFKDRVEEMGD